MKLTVIGSSDAFNSAGRGHSCYWLHEQGNAPFMVDFGCTALMTIQALGRSEKVRYFLFVKVNSPKVAGNAMFLRADMDINIYDLQVQGGRKLVGVSQVLNIAGKDELMKKLTEVVKLAKKTLR